MHTQLCARAGIHARIYMHIYIHACPAITYRDALQYPKICIHTYMHTYIHACPAITYIALQYHSHYMHTTYTYIHVHTYTHMYIHTYICIYIHTYMHTYVHIYMHTPHDEVTETQFNIVHTHTHTHTHTGPELT